MYRILRLFSIVGLILMTSTATIAQEGDSPESGVKIVSPTDGSTVPMTFPVIIRKM